MADVADPVTCAACGRQLPPQQGKGRRRRYCDARCRDAARRARARSGGRRPLTVNDSLTANSRQEAEQLLAEKVKESRDSSRRIRSLRMCLIALAPLWGRARK